MMNANVSWLFSDAIKTIFCGIFFSVMLSNAWASPEKKTIRIGSKTFAESYILAEITAQLLESRDYSVERKHNLGGTLIVYQALQTDDIDIYPEYTSTLSQVILKQPGIKGQQLAQALQQQNLLLLARFGFNNSYAIAIDSEIAQKKNIATISDLAKHPDLSASFSLEFLRREDGWPALSQHYQLQHKVRGIEHALAYRAIKSGELAVTDAYTTDGDIDTNSIRLLKDDKHFFPEYHAVLLARDDLAEPVVAMLKILSGSIDDNTMRALNQRATIHGEKPQKIASDFLLEKGFINKRVDIASGGGKPVGGTMIDNTLRHLKLTIIALVFACLVAIPLSLVLSQFTGAAKTVLYFVGLIQTIPSLALLALMIPVLGLGQTPAIVALFLYSLLPIIRNTLTGFFTVDPLLKQVARGMGLTVWQQLWKIELPLAVPQLLAGVKTAAIISIGTATLAAFVGAGGLGEPIIAGLTLNDNQLILQGAIPAALLAIMTEFIFEAIERVLIPKHLLGR